MTMQAYKSARKAQRARERARAALSDAVTQIRDADTRTELESAQRRHERVSLTLAAIDETLRGH